MRLLQRSGVRPVISGAPPYRSHPLFRLRFAIAGIHAEHPGRLPLAFILRSRARLAMRPGCSFSHAMPAAAAAGYCALQLTALSRMMASEPGSRRLLTIAALPRSHGTSGAARASYVAWFLPRMSRSSLAGTLYAPRSWRLSVRSAAKTKSPSTIVSNKLLKPLIV